MLEKDERMFREVLGLPTETLKVISEDTAHNKFLTDSNIMAVNFDKAAEQYCINNRISKYPASNDALYLFNEEWFFIEFKNGEIVDVNNGNNTTVADVREKITSSLNILFSIANNESFERCFPFFQKDIAYTVKNMNYILVYNEDKNRNATQADRKAWEQQIKDGIYNDEIRYLSENYRKIIIKTQKIREYERDNRDRIEKAREYLIKSTSNGTFLKTIKNIRDKMSGQDCDSGFDDILDILSQEAFLPIMRFGLDKYKGSFFKEVYTYTCDVLKEDGTYKHGEFYERFVRVFEEKEREYMQNN